MNRPLAVIFTTIMLDAMGIGLIFPILPALLQDVARAPDIAPLIGMMGALYAVMQFTFAPVLGAASDRFGRRPVLLLSLAGAVAGYLLLASASSLWMLVLGRAVAGLTGANGPVAAAYITDLTPPGQRARRFGLLNAMFGTGFIVGPVLGGLLGDQWLRLPFLMAALLNGGTLLLALLALPETHRSRTRRTLAPADLNPLRPLRWAMSVRTLSPLIAVFFLFSAGGEAYGICWALWGGDTFHWTGLWIGLSLGTFGLCQTLAQTFLPGPAVRILGERGAVLTGMACQCAALMVMAVARQGWLVFAIMPLFSLGGIGTPALLALATRQVDAARQGQVQGVLASAVSLASILAPPGFSGAYVLARPHWPGAVWLAVILLNAIGALLVLGLRFDQPSPPQSLSACGRGPAAPSPDRDWSGRPSAKGDQP
ncbi:TCR/Tet family MFS transporter [Oleisolibacter albus]|uniref:TCR/Tet family MFS transporter n=1 Tax=Oleisolibacter albus TaxID=2171757 RepID=UPI000DF2E985|nr:TCR/Tet family MFS transporter [Oleisolibacter albus]